MHPFEPVLIDAWNKLQGLTYWLSAGTLLGIYRDGDIIPHDTDIDFGMLGPVDIADINARLVGYEHTKLVFVLDRVMQLVYFKDDVFLDIYVFYVREDGYLINYNDGGIMLKPTKMINLRDVEFHGKIYKAPEPEEYLAWRYRDWRTPTTQKVTWIEDAGDIWSPSV